MATEIRQNVLHRNNVFFFFICSITIILDASILDMYKCIVIRALNAYDRLSKCRTLENIFSCNFKQKIKETKKNKIKAIE